MLSYDLANKVSYHLQSIMLDRGMIQSLSDPIRRSLDQNELNTIVDKFLINIANRANIGAGRYYSEQEQSAMQIEFGANTHLNISKYILQPRVQTPSPSTCCSNAFSCFRNTEHAQIEQLNDGRVVYNLSDSGFIVL